MKKTILVTGASSGIGLSVATHLAKRGYTVYGACRSGAENPDFAMVRLDVTDEQGINKIIKEIIEKEGRIDGVMNNAGLGYAGAFENASLSEVRKVFEVNVFGTMMVSQAVLPYMRKQGCGHIINVSTLGSIMGLPFRAFYSSSKAAVDMMTETLRLEVKRFGIQVCLIHPGDVKTNIGQRRVISSPENDRVYGNIFTKTYHEIDKDVENGFSPEVFGPLVDKILSSKHVRRNYYVGNFSQKLGMRLKKILPFYMFEPIISHYYKAE